MIVYYSTKSGYTHKFVQKLGIENLRIPISSKDVFSVDQRYVLIVPTYCDHQGNGAVPAAVMSFLRHRDNATKLCGVIGGGNRNFHENFAKSATVISQEFHVPALYKFELMGNDRDVRILSNEIPKFLEKIKTVKNGSGY